MKKVFLLTACLTAVLHSAFSQTQGLPQLPWQKDDPSPVYRGVQDRNAFPVLLTDSVHCNSYQSSFPYELSQENFHTYQYDNQEKVIKERYRNDNLPVIGNWHLLTYTRDGMGRIIESLTVEEIAPNIFLNVEKTEVSYAPDGTTAESKYYNWDGTDWNLYYRKILTYDDEDRVKEELNQGWDGFTWSNYTRITSDWDANDNQILYRNETWDPNTSTWYTTYESVRVYDNDSKLLSQAVGFGSLFAPFQPSFKYEYHYDAQGRNDYTDEYGWEETLNQWFLSGKEVHTYNAQNELEQTLQYGMVNQSLVEVGRFLYTYGEGIYTDLPEVQLYQVLEQGIYKDQQRTTTDFSDLPDGKVAFLYEYVNQEPPGSGTWIPRFDCNIIYHISTLSSSGQPVEPAPCVAPNPYAAGTRVSCSGLKDNYSYMLWVYSLDGRVSYARQFNGAEGWSVERQLPSGMYLAVVTHNGKRVSAQKIVFE